MSRIAAAFFGLLIVVCPGYAAEKRPMTVDDLYRFLRVSDPQISPDGTQVVYVVGTITDPAKNKSKSNLWLAATDGKTPPRQLTTTDKKDSHARWSPDGKRLLFESTRSGGEPQLWTIDTGGGEARQLSHVSTGAGNALWSRDGSHIAFVSAVFPEFSDKPFAESDKLDKERLEAEESSPVKARSTNKLFWRHWDSYVEGKRQHLFVMKADGSDVRDVTPGDRDAFPTSDTFSSGDNFTFSPDGKSLVFTAVPEKAEAWSTNYDLCRVSIDNKSKDWECLTKDNPAADTSPAFSPDGTRLAYRAQKKPGYEADQWKMMVVDCDESGVWKGQPKIGATDFDSSVDEIVWIDNGRLIFTADAGMGKALFKVSLAQGKPESLVQGQWLGSMALGFPDFLKGSKSALSISRDGGRVTFVQAALTAPGEVMTRPSLDVVRPEDDATYHINLSHANDRLLSEINMSNPQSVDVPIEGGKMQMWILKPPGFDETKKYPLAFLVHGGPQGAWEDGWSYRWCPELWAAQGYVVALPNPRGSTGFGQKFVEEISGDWGGKCYDDLMKGADYVAALPYVDKDRMIASGASFGGYMMNWFAVNTGRFKALVTHCGVYDFDSMYGTTDEVWFDEFEHGGPPWGGRRDSYEKHSPHRLAANLGKFKTPMLVIQNDLDFRCPVGQGIELFTALQRQGVPSRFVNFPDEGHWVLKPANSKRWHQEVFGWITKYCPPGGK
jgi:dipeptidyl aminopeptidase/acylaminoacyl peptidase